MIGLVLWYNPDAHVGMIWCEDQGPLAFLGPEVDLPEGVSTLGCGDQLTFTVDMREGVRFVRDVFVLAPGVAAKNPAEILAGYHSARDAERHLYSVA